eukprot:scaffold125634_cov21-Prasinocladus_malaysianus.AAC.3
MRLPRPAGLSLACCSSRAKSRLRHERHVLYADFLPAKIHGNLSPCATKPYIGLRLFCVLVFQYIRQAWLATWVCNCVMSVNRIVGAETPYT